MTKLLTLGALLSAILFGVSMRTTAEEPAAPFAVGDKIRFLYIDNGPQMCDVQEIRGSLVRCAQGADNGRWLNMAVTMGFDTKR